MANAISDSKRGGAIMPTTPNAERTFIAFFGAVNAGKSSVINRVTAQPLSIVSDTPGTTTDPVTKSMELLPLGAVTLCDTAGFDDTTALGIARMEKTKEILRKTDIAVLVIDASVGKTDADRALEKEFQSRGLPYVLCYNKSELLKSIPEQTDKNTVYVSAITGEGIEKLKNTIAALGKKEEKPIVSDLFTKGDLVVLVTPIDEAAPKGRLILPQQLVLRELLDIHATVVLTQHTELADTLASFAKPPKAVITDSQVFDAVKDIVPEAVYLTSFSILMQRYKGILDTALRGADALDTLRDGDTVLIAEGCTHHRQCNDIGTVKLPNWIKKHTGKALNFEFSSGGHFPDELARYALVVHCGGCMLNEKEMRYRERLAIGQNVPFTNFGIIIAKMNGILDISVKILYNSGHDNNQ